MDTATTEATPRIGVFNQPLVIVGNGPVNRTPNKVNLILTESAMSPPDEPPAILNAQGEEIPSITWPEYLAWRKTKCRPYDRESLFNLKTTFNGKSIGGWNNHRVLEEIDQATHELVGEVAELAELFTEHGIRTFYGEERRKLIDECGDIFFCASWAFDAWGDNPLAGLDDIELARVQSEKTFHAQAARVLGTFAPEDVERNTAFMADFGGFIMRSLIAMQTEAGLLCNSFKKLRWQRREQDVTKQIGRIGTVLAYVNEILIVANSNVEEALKVNMRKLNARYPDGVSLSGGGIRTGDGK